ncbi:MAG TPA: triose-phosphate isomerase [Candidatus Acidoferrales bacterium]|nr:triose-phosphate isomerase [Candidatus Acidoferrales bacterium]
MRRPVIAANWKMYKTQAETRSFFARFRHLAAELRHCDLIVAPPFTALAAAVEAARGSQIAISAQDLYWEKEGAWTGQVSATMIAETGCHHTLIGHSERRHIFQETDDQVHRKLRAALGAGLGPIVCVGETLAERDGGRMEEVLARQFNSALKGLTAAEFSRILVAYEPVWAIGTGRVATPEQAATAHCFIRGLAGDAFSAAQAQALRILYGGSVKPENCNGLLTEPEIDGALVGGASLDPVAFASIARGSVK